MTLFDFPASLSLNSRFSDFKPGERRANDAKISISKAAATLIAPCSLVIFDGGPASVEVAKSLPFELKITVITNSLSVAMALSHHPGVELIMLGGRVLKGPMSTVSVEALNFLNCVRADLCFLGVRAIHPEIGVSDLEVDELPIKQRMIRSSSKIVALAPSDKFGVVAPFVLCPVSVLNTIVTDAQASVEILDIYHEIGIEILR